MQTTKKSGKQAKAQTPTPDPMQALREQLKSDGFALVRARVGAGRELWCDGKTVEVIQDGKREKISVQRALELWSLIAAEKQGADWDKEGEEHWTQLLSNGGIFVELNELDIAAVGMIAEGWKGCTVQELMTETIRGSLRAWLEGCSSDLQELSDKCVELPKEIMGQLEKTAKEDGRSPAEQVAWLIDRHIERLKQSKPAKLHV